MKNLILIFIFTLVCISLSAAADNGFGRFYTSPRQRMQLDEQRIKRPDEEIVVDIVPDNLMDITSEEETVTIIDSITLNGLVYRTDGKNTAWLNSNSTNEGSIENQYTRVNENNVHSNNVEITLPDNQSRIELKVGQQYDVRSKQVYDLAKDPVSSLRDMASGSGLPPPDTGESMPVPTDLPPPPILTPGGPPELL
ncbi:MAG: hypothetical protein ACI9XC_000005 [Gammaproteobacteria bacterium]|jgi:hypothetical protein